MRWLLIGLLVSLGALLLAAAGAACHILLQRAKLRRNPPGSSDSAVVPAEETDIELEP